MLYSTLLNFGINRNISYVVSIIISTISFIKSSQIKNVIKKKKMNCAIIYYCTFAIIEIINSSTIPAYT